ncbi:MAG: ABC transporter permease [Gammaproteobacteria bacterium]
MAQIIKELLCLLRDPKSRFVLIGPPLIQLCIFSFAATLEVKHVDIAVYNRDAGLWSRELLARVSAASFVGHLHPVHDPGQIERLMEERKVIAAIDIPESFSRDIKSGRIGKAQLILDGRRANASQVLFGYLNNVIGDLDARFASNAENDADRVTVRHWFNPNLIYRWFIVPSIGGILVTFVTLLVTSLSIARERELGTFDQLLVSPCTPTEIIVAKMVPALLVCTLLGSFMVAAGVFGFGVPFTGSFVLLFVSLVIFILSVVGIGLMISSICATQQQAILGTFAVGVPAVLMSGFATPVENMPVLLQWLAQAIPLKHYLIILQGSFLKALPPSEVFANLWQMVVIALVTLSAAIVFVRSRLQ